MTLLFLLLKPLLLMLVKRVFKKQMKQFAVDMFEAEVEAGSAAATGALMNDLFEGVFNKVLGIG